MKIMSALIAVTALATTAATLLSAAPAFAMDDQVVCEDLWVARNQIYKDNGYCFKTQNAIDYFGNGGCSHQSQSSVHLSKGEAREVRRIRNREVKLGCDNI